MAKEDLGWDQGVKLDTSEKKTRSGEDSLLEIRHVDLDDLLHTADIPL
jgi:hypothetical protein